MLKCVRPAAIGCRSSSVEEGRGVDPPLEVRSSFLDPEEHEATATKQTVRVVDRSCSWDADGGSMGCGRWTYDEMDTSVV